MLQPLQNPQQSLQMQIQWATVGSLEDWYNYLFDKMPLETNRLLKLKNITEMVNFLTNDLRETCGKFQKHFQDCLGLDYSRQGLKEIPSVLSSKLIKQGPPKIHIPIHEGLIWIIKKHKNNILCFISYFKDTLTLFLDVWPFIASSFSGNAHLIANSLPEWNALFKFCLDC